MSRTTVKQKQVAPSSQILDNLPLGYSNIPELETDLNYLRSVIRDLKGTVAYDSPLLKSLEEIAQELEGLSFEDVHLGGNSTAETPPLSDDSERIATTSYVTEKLSAVGGDSRYVHTQGTADTVWVIHHPLLKIPSVTCVDSTGTTVYGNIVYDEFDNSRLEVHFGGRISGRAYLN